MIMGSIGQQMSAAYTSVANSIGKTTSKARETGSAIASVVKDFKMPTIQNVKAEKADIKLQNLNNTINGLLETYQSKGDREVLGNAYNNLSGVSARSSEFFGDKALGNRDHYQEITQKESALKDFNAVLNDAIANKKSG